jgi:hypothetical protein
MKKAKGASLFESQVAEPPMVPKEGVEITPKRGAALDYRKGKKTLSTWINEEAFWQLKAMAAEEKKTLQDYMVGMINERFAKRGRPQIA